MRFFSMKSGIRILSGLLVIAVLTSLPAAFGQAVTAGMAGEVTDQSGAEVANVAVTLTNATTGSKFATTTNADGFYRFSEIPPGQGYSATFSAKGFATAHRQGHLPDDRLNSHPECGPRGQHSY